METLCLTVIGLLATSTATMFALWRKELERRIKESQEHGNQFDELKTILLRRSNGTTP